MQRSLLEFFRVGFYPISARRGKEAKRDQTETAQSTAFVGTGASAL